MISPLFMWKRIAEHLFAYKGAQEYYAERRAEQKVLYLPRSSMRSLQKTSCEYSHIS